MRLALIRHGEPQASLDAVVAGAKGCSGLSDRGRREAVSLRDRLARTHELRTDVVLTSVLPRAVETADLLAPAIGPAQQSCDLCELHPGECDGEPWAAHAANYPSPEHPDRIFSSGGESLRSFDRRVRQTMNDVLHAHHGLDVVVIAHSGVIEATTLMLMRAPGLAEARPFTIDALQYTSITEWELGDDGRWRLNRYNDHAHLFDGSLDASTREGTKS